MSSNFLIQLEKDIPVGYPITITNFYKLHTDAPNPLTKAFANSKGYDFFIFSPRPDPETIGERYKTYVEGKPTKDEAGNWVQTWVVADMTDAEKSESYNRQLQISTARLNNRLSQCLWVEVTPDLPYHLIKIWNEYRDKLKNLPSTSADWPWTFRWPANPLHLPPFNPSTHRAIDLPDFKTVEESQWIIEEILQSEQTLDVEDAIYQTQRRLDSFAQTRGYDNVNSTAKYKDITNEEILLLPEAEQGLVTKFRTESRYIALAVASTWARLYVILDEIQNGLRPRPSSFNDIESELPQLVWPV